MASWSAAPAHVDAPVAAPRRKPRAVPRRPANPLRSGVTWIVLLAALLGGVVALNVAVLQLNVRLDELGRERTQLRDAVAQLESERASAVAAPRIQSLARKRLGLVFPPPCADCFIELGK